MDVRRSYEGKTGPFLPNIWALQEQIGENTALSLGKIAGRVFNACHVGMTTEENVSKHLSSCKMPPWTLLEALLPKTEIKICDHLGYLGNRTMGNVYVLVSSLTPVPLSLRSSSYTSF
jgi:hypothetical protein